MREIESIGSVILSDKFHVDRVDLPSNKEDNKAKLREIGVSDETLDRITFNNGTEDIVGRFVDGGERVAFEAKGTTKDSYSNFKYWSKGIINQMAQLDDKTDAESVGIVIPAEVSDVLRGVMSSHNSSVSRQDAHRLDASEVYGQRQSSVMRQFYNDDYVVLAESEGITVQDWEYFFGL